MPNDALTRFAETIIRQASENKNETIEREMQKSKSELDEARAEIRRQSNLEMQRAFVKIKNDAARRVAAAKTEYRANLLKRRAQICDEVFAEAKARLGEFVLSDGYGEWFSKSLSESLEKTDADDAVCTVLRRDEAAAKSMGARLRVEVTDKDIIGGFTLRSEKRRLLCDRTLAAALDEQRDYFYSASNLTIGG